VRHIRQLIDLTLDRLDRAYLSGPARGAQAAASLAWLLATYHRQFNYRRSDMAAALELLDAGLPAAEIELDPVSSDVGTGFAAGPKAFGYVDVEWGWWAALT